MPALSFQQGSNNYSGTKDTYIRESKPNISYANTTGIFVDASDSALKEMQGLLQFSAIFGSAAGQIPLGARITSATVTLSVTDGSSNGASFYRMEQDWALRPVWSWAAFGDGIQTDGVEARATHDVTLSRISKGKEVIDVTQSLQAWSLGEQNNGWLLRTPGSDGWEFDASESAAAPVLTVTYDLASTPPPELAPALVIVESDGRTLVAEGGLGDTISVALSAAPSQSVTVTISITGSGDVTMSPTTLTFTSANWNIASQISFAAIDDAIVEGTEQYTVRLATTSADAAYNNLTSIIPVTVIDNDRAAPVLAPRVVAVHDATTYSAGDPSGTGAADPSGLAYLPGRNTLLIVDSEHDESPFNSQINLFEVRLDGTFVQSYSMRAFTREPTGIAFNPTNGLLYVSDDDKRKIFVVSPDDPTMLVSQIDVGRLGIVDAEDPVIDPETGNIFLLDGYQRKLFELSPSGELIGSKALPSAITDAEALAFDPAADAFYISSGAARGTIFQTDLDGTVTATIDILAGYRHPDSGGKPKIKGLELAPSSDPHDGDAMSLYAADYGVDQSPDGRLFEISLYDDSLFA